MNTNKQIPQGYKPSPLGIIPENWEVKRIGDFGKVITGNTPPTEDTDNYGDVYKFVSPADISGNKYIEATEKHLSEKGFSISRQMPKGTVLFTCIGSTIGKCAIANEALTSNQQINAIICDSKHSGEFLYYELCHRSNRIKQIAGEQAVPIINKSTFESYKVLCPPFEEQKNIAEILSLWDTAITKQTALIERLTLRKRGLMQQLLTGKKRLKGFNEKWKEVRLGDVASINRGGSPRPIEHYLTSGEGYNWIKIGDVGVNAKYITSTEEKIIKEGLSKTRFVKSGDFILSNSMSFGRPYILKINGCIHDGWLVIQEYDKTFNIDFLYYILGYDATLAQYKSMAAGSGVLNLNKEIVKEVLLKIPPIDEQKAIASILVNADKEIELANKKLASLQAQKRGLMQVLLTGKKRIN